jgi:hypothetical protein
MTWSTPDACPKAADGREDVPTPEEKASSGGGGVGKFFKVVFWMLSFGLLFYFVIGTSSLHSVWFGRSLGRYVLTFAYLTRGHQGCITTTPRTAREA